MADRKKLTEEELAALSPSDRAHYEIKGRLGDGMAPEDTESTKAAREAAFSEDAGKHAEPDPSSVSKTRSPSVDDDRHAVRKGSGEDKEAKGTTPKKASQKKTTAGKDSDDK